MPVEKLLIINSRDKISGSNSDFTVQFNDSIAQEVVKIICKEFYIPNQFYNVENDGKRKNNTLVLNQNGVGNLTISVPEGQYNIDTLIATLKTRIDNILIDNVIVTITKNNTTNKLTFTFTGASNPANNNVSFVDTSLIKSLIGFDATIPAVSTVNMPYPWNLNQLQYVQVHSPELASTHGMDAGANTTINLLETVSLNSTGFGGVAYKQANDDELHEIIYDDQRVIQQVRIKLRDSDGNILSLPDNHHCTIIVKAYF
jgi:CRISPR/Cas system-associated endoribonuclease Cas2